MKSIDLMAFYELGQAMARVQNLPDETCQAGQFYFTMVSLRASVSALMSGKLMDAGVVRVPAKDLIDRFANLSKKYFTTEDGKFRFPKDEVVLESWEMSGVKGYVERLEHVLSAQAKMASTYHANKIGIFDTGDLVENGEKVFPEAVLDKVNPAALAEYRAAGRALAFEMPTASGFHVARAVEIQLRDYRNSIIPTNAGRTMGAMIHALKAHADSGSSPTPDARTLRQLDQIRDLDRNRIMHPDDTLDAAQAMVFFLNGVGAITAMVSEMQKITGVQLLAVAESASAILTRS